MTLQTLDLGFWRREHAQRQPHAGLVVALAAVPGWTSAVHARLGQVIAETYQNWQRQRRRNKNLRHALTLDGATLRDLGLNRADIQAMCDGHLAFSQANRAAAALLAMDHDLKRSWNSEALEQLTLMDDYIR